MIEPFVGFPKIARLSRDIIVTEKIDGTNGQIVISDDGLEIQAASRTRYITPQDDNYGFAQWVFENKEELLKLGPGRHFGEWWGKGIQRNYGIDKKVFSLFNVGIWNKDNIPSCCSVVPVLYNGYFNTKYIEGCILHLQQEGSRAAPGFMKPEGVIIYHTAANIYFKKTLEKDEKPKGQKDG